VIAEPMIADPDVNNIDVSKRYTIQLDHFLSMVVIKSRSWFHWFLYGSQGDMKILAQMLKNIDEKQGKVGQSTTSCCSSTYNIVDEKKKETGKFYKIFRF
jgi:aconitate hydratase 2/2-methylisocitrate dehydratase